jgi:tight adherence protein C
MQASALLNYPEFIVAGLVGIFVLFGLGKEQEVHCPQWLADPAMNCLNLAPVSYLVWLHKTLIQAGWRNPYSIGDFASLKLYLPLLSLMSSFVLPLHIVGIAAITACFLPDLILCLALKRRQRQINESLPRAIDLMVLCVDAGLGLESTIQKIATEETAMANALNDELNILSRELLLGTDRERAYLDLYNRTGVDELKTFGSALGQASKLGLSIAQILRAQSEFIRKKQGQKIEEKAMRMPIYMAFPLWFCIMPSLMLLVLGPSLIKFYNSMHGIPTARF